MTELSAFAQLSLLITILGFLVAFFIPISVTYKRFGEFPPHRYDLRNFLLVFISLLWIAVSLTLVINPTLINLFGVINLLMNNSIQFLLIFIGIIHAISGIGLMFLAFFEMESSFRMGIPPEELEPAPLITSGIFKYIRNPGFLAYDLGAIGTFLFAPSLALLIIVLAICVIFHLQILQEEQYLTNVHGDTYLTYLNSVGRYFPKLLSYQVIKGNKSSKI